MKPYSLFSRPEFKRKEAVHKDTAYWIFDYDQDAALMFQVNKTHFMMRNNQQNFPIPVGPGARPEHETIAEMMPTRGRVMDMVDYYIDGAQLYMTPKVAAEAYKRIVNHMEAHVRASTSSKFYVAPDPEDFRQMADFALAIHAWAKSENPHLDGQHADGYQIAGNWTRPTMISRNNPGMEANASSGKRIVPRPMRQRDMLEKYFELIGE